MPGSITGKDLLLFRRSDAKKHPDPTTHAKLVGALEVAYETLNGQQRAQLNYADIVLAIQRISESAPHYPRLTQMTITQPNVAKGRLFHQVRAGDVSRKHDKTELQAEHDQRVTEMCIAYWTYKMGRYPPADVVLGWLYHDSAEDYKVTFNQIRLFSGRAVERDVRVVTIPPETILRLAYPETHDAVDLKNRSKADNVPLFMAPNVILKFFDNMDAKISYIDDMERGLITMTFDLPLVDTKATPQILSFEELVKKSDHRKRYARLLLDRAAEIASDPIMNPDRIDLSTMALDLVPIYTDLTGKLIKTAYNSAAHFEDRLIFDEQQLQSMFDFEPKRRPLYALGPTLQLGSNPALIELDAERQYGGQRFSVVSAAAPGA